MKRTTKRLLALLLCAVMTVGLLPAMAADLVYFPEFSACIGEGMEPDGPWPAVGSSAIPKQSYFYPTDNWEECKELAEEYIKELEDTGDFEVASSWKVVYGKEGGEEVHYSCALRYTGSAKMNGTLKALHSDKTWPDYGEYHIAVRAERDASRPNPARRNSVTVRWDAALRPEGIDLYGDPEKGDDRPDNTDKEETGGNAVGNSDNTFPDLDSAMGYYLSCSDEGLYYEDTSKNPMSYDELLQVAQEYVDLLVSEDNFYLKSRRKNGQLVDREDTSWSDGKCSTWYIGYAGTAPMEEDLAAGGAIDWNNYGPFHLKITVWDSGKRCYITVAWDDGLEPVESNRRTPTGARLGSAERPPEKVTAVLMIGYNQMCVGSDVMQVDKSDAVTPVVENNRTLVPVSRIVDAFGGGSTWDAAQRVAGFTLEDRSVTHKIGTKTIQVTGAGTETRTMNAPSKLMHNRTYVPARYILEGLGLWVGYEPNYKLVVVSTEDLDGEDLVKLPESQRLFASEEVPETASKYVEHYVIDGMNYTMEVGEALTLYNSHSAISTYSAYTWDVLDGSELVKVDRSEATCRFYAKRPGTVTVKAEMLQSVQGSIFSADTFNSSETVTITIVPATGQGSAGGLMHWQTCPSCNGTGKIRSGTTEITCPTCLGKKQVLLP